MFQAKINRFKQHQTNHSSLIASQQSVSTIKSSDHLNCLINSNLKIDKTSPLSAIHTGNTKDILFINSFADQSFDQNNLVINQDLIQYCSQIVKLSCVSTQTDDRALFESEVQQNQLKMNSTLQKQSGFQTKESQYQSERLQNISDSQHYHANYSSCQQHLNTESVVQTSFQAIINLDIKSQRVNLNNFDYCELQNILRNDSIPNQKSLIQSDKSLMKASVLQPSLSAERMRKLYSQNFLDQNQGLFMNQKQISLIRSVSIKEEKINQQQFQQLSARICILENQITQKDDEIHELNMKSSEVNQQLQRLHGIEKQYQTLKRNYKQLEDQIKFKNKQLERVTNDLQKLQYEFQKIQELEREKELKIQNFLLSKQNQIKQLQSQLYSVQQESKYNEQNLTEQNQNLQKILYQKTIELNETRAEYQFKYEIYIASIKEMKAKIYDYEQKIEKIQTQLKIYLNEKKMKELNQNYKEISQEYKLTLQMLKNKQLQAKSQQPNRNLSIEEQKNQANSIQIQSDSLPLSSNQQVWLQYPQLFSQDPKVLLNLSAQILQKIKKQNLKLNLINQYDFIKDLQTIFSFFKKYIVKNSESKQMEKRMRDLTKELQTKENLNQTLSEKLRKSQSSLNQLMLQKVESELQNRKLIKLIQDFQLKLSKLGNRLSTQLKSHSTGNQSL